MVWKWVRNATVVLFLPFAFQACAGFDDATDLEVINQNAPDAARALSTPGDIEALIGSGFQIWHSANEWEGPSQMLSTGGDEGSYSWGNFAVKDVSSEPRVIWNNASSYTYAYANEDTWFTNYEALSAVFDGLKAIAADETIKNKINVPRVEAYAKFIQGLAHGWLALMFDSAFVFDESINLETDQLELQAYPAVMAAALGYLDEAIAGANNASWSLPPSWINGNTLTGPQLAAVARGYAARFLSQVGRTPADRAAQSWDRILGYASNSIATDLMVASDGADQWFKSLEWRSTEGRTWARADYRTIAVTEAGTGGGYDAWLATPVAFRQPFDLDVPDRRVTSGPPPHTEFVEAGLDFGHWGQPDHPEARGTYHWSFYGHSRYNAYPNSGGVTDMTFMTVVEMDLIEAEARIRLNQAGAAALINNTRESRGNLPPVNDNDADLMESLMYETQIETFFLCAGCPYFNRRGWAPLADNGATHHFGLITGSPLHWPIPGSELEVLQKKNYTFGGKGNEGAVLTAAAPAAGNSVTGVPAWRVYTLGEFDSAREKLEFIRSKRAVSAGVVQLSRYR